MDISKLDDNQLARLINSRWSSAETVWDVVNKTYSQNIDVYKNNPSWINSSVWPKNKAKVRANRIFRNTESVVNALIANPPQPNILPTRDTPEAKDLASTQEKYFLQKYDDLNVKEILRKGLRNLYFARLIVLKPFWNYRINDFDVRSLDPRNIRVAKNATKEDDTDFVIEEVTDSITNVINRFPKKKDLILKERGFANEEEAFIQNPDIQYKEAWIDDYLVFKYGNHILGKIKNPYWDWDGLVVTAEEDRELAELGGEDRKTFLNSIREVQEERKTMLAMVSELEEQTEEIPEELRTLSAYYFNHFDFPRKPYIFATIFNNENTPVGQTDMIEQSIPLQEAIDRRKQDIDENASLVNGQIKVDSAVMSKADAQKLRYQPRGVIWGKNVGQGVTREMGSPLPQFVFDDMIDSRNEIDNIMAATSAFRGEREGQETKAGRLALIEQSYLNLNELVQVVDYCSQELFNWFYQLAKTRYTEHHYAKVTGREKAIEIISLTQDDFEDGVEVRIIPGKTLPEDKQFKFEQAQQDVATGILSPIDYFEVAGYDNPMEKARNAVLYRENPAAAVGLPSPAPMGGTLTDPNAMIQP